jgi:peptidoglycan/LPS O-acetylase OafA/YrhL
MYYYYSDAITWTVAALAIAWITWFFVRRYLRARALRRPHRRRESQTAQRIVKVIKQFELEYLRPGFSN